MSLWFWIPLGIYLLGAIVFLIAVVMEAPKHAAEIGLLHIVIALVWPFWALWYIYVLISDKISKWRNK
jgi:hypothetical protein